MNSHKLLAYGPLPIRLLAGITFLAHGLPKFENIAGTQGFFGSIGLPPELALPIGILLAPIQHTYTSIESRTLKLSLSIPMKNC
jgi:uncharacterized membrane protein YphA (DoxX/SURF4 family)